MVKNMPWQTGEPPVGCWLLTLWKDAREPGCFYHLVYRPGPGEYRTTSITEWWPGEEEREDYVLMGWVQLAEPGHDLPTP